MANIWVSNGTCFTGAGSATDIMIPCGNAYFGHVACCQASDFCLSSSVCYNNEFGTTYVTGCTDPDYSDAVCPDKFDDSDAPWLGMSYCNGTSNEWVLCDQADHPSTLQAGDPCWCPLDPSDRAMTLSAPTAIVGTASLPSATGLTIAWDVGFYPTTPVLTVAVTSTVSNAGAAAATASSSSSTDYTSPEQPPFPTGFSSEAKVGTAIGAAVFGLLLLGILAFLIFRCRRAKQAQNNNNGIKPSSTDPNEIGIAYGTLSGRHGVGGGGGAHDVSAMSIGGPSPHMSMVSELDNKAARPWSGMSELDGHGGRGGFAGPAGAGHMEAIAEASHGYGLGNGGRNSGRIEQPRFAMAHAELEAQRAPVELPA